MKCEKCGKKTKTNDSRHSKLYNSVIRRRECLKCGFKFNTRETNKDILNSINSEVEDLKDKINDLKLINNDLGDRVLNLSEHNKLLVDKLKTKNKRCIN